MDGTEEFLDLALEAKNCQNEESVLECRSKKYLDTGKNRCGCIPYHLRTSLRTVRNCQIPVLELLANQHKLRLLSKESP